MRPTREGRVSPNRPGLVYKGIGVDPEAPTDDPEEPTDRATGGDASVPFLPPPDPGPTTDLNLAYGTDYDGGGTQAVVDPTNANDGNLSTLAYRASFYNGGGTKTWWLEADLGSALDVESIVIRGGWGNAGENDPPWVVQHSPDSSTWTTAVGSYVWTPTSGPETATLTLTSTQTKRYWRVGQTITFTGLIYPLKAHTFAINGPSAGDPTNIIWVDAPLTIDGDDATYDYAYDTGIEEFWRIDLGDTFLIDSIDARLAYETAGSNPLIVKATNESDYSSLVTVATIPLTATGTFTAQNVTDSWTPSTAYRYWVLVQTTEVDIRIHSVELLTAADSATTIHGLLTGRDDADQHPADAVTFTPYSTIAATNVQDAIEEVLDEAAAVPAILPIALAPPGCAIAWAGTNSAAPTNATADIGRAAPIIVPGTMRVRSLWIHVSSNGAGAIEWGLFDLSTTLTAATKVAGGSAAPGGTGWREITAASAPVVIAAKTYMLIVENPASTQSTISTYSTAANPGFFKAQATYVWDNTPDLTSGWTDSSLFWLCYIEGDMNASGTRW